MKNPHKHHIIPDYRCKELGMAPGYKVDGVEFYFKENCLPDIKQIDHALIHWGYFHNDLKPLFEFVTPAQWIIDLIPIGDARDYGAAVLNARGGIDGIDMSGKNHPRYKDGKLIGVRDDPKIRVAYDKERKQTPEFKAWRKEFDRKRRSTPEHKEYMRVYQQAMRAKNKLETGYAKGYSQAKNKAETQGEGTLEKWLT